MSPLDKKLDSWMDKVITVVFGVGFVIAFWAVVIGVALKILSFIF